MFIAGLEAAQHLKDQKGNRGRERGLMRQWRCHAFVDPSGGSNDSMTPALAQKEGILDTVREGRAPFSPEAVVEEFANELKR